MRFVAATQTIWSGGGDGKSAIDIRLLITNLTEADIWFSTFDTFYLIIKDLEGNFIAAGGAHDGTIVTKPVLIPAGKTYALIRAAELSRVQISAKEIDLTKKVRFGFSPIGGGVPFLNFIYWDGTGGWASGCFKFADQRYKLSFYVDSWPSKRNLKTPPHPIWSGRLCTQEVEFFVAAE